MLALALPGVGDPAQARAGELSVQHRPFRSFDQHFTALGRDISHLGMVFRGRYKLAKEDKLATELAVEPPKISSDGKAYTMKMPGPIRLAATDPSTSS